MEGVKERRRKRGGGKKGGEKEEEKAREESIVREDETCEKSVKIRLFFMNMATYQW